MKPMYFVVHPGLLICNDTMRLVESTWVLDSFCAANEIVFRGNAVGLSA